MMLALLPLAIATITANWHSIQTTEHEKQELLSAATKQNAGQLRSTINAIRTAQSLTANVLEKNGQDREICGRLQSLFNSLADPGGIRVAIFTSSGRALCQSVDGRRLYDEMKNAGPDAPDTLIVPALNGVLIRSQSIGHSITAISLYSRSALRKLANDEGNGADQYVVLKQGDISLPLAQATAASLRSNTQTLNATAPVHTSSDLSHDLLLTTQVSDSISTGARLAALLMPLLLWVAAVFLGWLVVHWMLIKPLTTLRREVASYHPGTVIHPPRLSRFASSEIVELGQSFHAVSEEIASHEEMMKAALDRQTRLTREVHHRVKNNLQIISSLISLHWRASEDSTAGDAYLSIQRRVDALAVVQRNHYADMDEDRGLRAQPMLNEIASALKISARVQSGANVNITVNCDDLMLHQDVATAIAFMTAELADLVISLAPDAHFSISLLRDVENPSAARFSLIAPVFQQAMQQGTDSMQLYERVLTGLARQLRTPLGHNAEQGEYHITIPVMN